MKKNLLTLMFVVAFLCGSALVVSAKSAKTSSSPANSIAVSKKVLLAKAKANSLKARCKVAAPCDAEFGALLFWNAVYEYYCAPDYLASCSPGVAQALINAGGGWEACMNQWYNAKNIDRDMDRKKTEKSQDVMSR